MKNHNHFIKNCVLSKDRKVNKICEPLRNHLDIPVFVYYKIRPDGSFATLSNFVEQLEFYYSEELFLSNPYLVHPQLLSSGCVMTRHTDDPDYLATIDRTERKYRLHNTFLMIDCNADGMEGFFFGDMRKDYDRTQDYLQHLELLKRFSQHFKREAAVLIKKQDAEKFDLASVMGEKFHVRDPKLPLAKSPSADAFLKSIFPLSKRERECLDLFQAGKSAQATAAILGLSRRTVEHYFENIKDKLACTSKWELLDY